MLWLYSCVARLMVVWSCIGATIAMTMNHNFTCDTNVNHLILQPSATAFISSLISVHGQGSDGFGCGDVNQDAIQPFEAMRWALELLNKKNFVFNTELLKTSYVPGVKIGMIVSDTCMSHAIAKAATGQLYPALPSTLTKSCSKHGNQISLGLIEDNPDTLSGKLHAIGSEYSLPLVSFSSKISSNPSQKRDFFLRTAVPQRALLLKVTSKLLVKLNWQRVAVVHTGDKSSLDAFQHLVRYTKSLNICLVDVSITETTADVSLSNALTRILQTEAIGVVYIGSNDVAEALMRYAPKVQNSGKLQWVFVDSLSVTSVQRSEVYKRGSIVVVPATRKIVEFEDHWVRLKAFDLITAENRWFKEWYAAEYNCDIEKNCPRKSENEKRSTFVQDPSVEPAVMAVYAYANALKQAHKDKCGGVSGLCAELRNLRRDHFIRLYLKKVDFVFGTDERVSSLASHSLDPYGAPKHLRFHDNGDIVNDACDVFHLNSQSGIFKFRNIGTYFETDDQLHINTQNLRMYSEDRQTILPRIPTSPCPHSGCATCADIANKPKHLYIPGDLVLNVVLPIHGAGETAGTCDSDLTVNKVTTIEAMIHGVDYINRAKTLSGVRVLNGVKLGLLVHDSCTSATLAQVQAESAHSGLTTVQSADGEILDPRNIVAYAAESYSSLSIAFSRFTNRVKKPQISSESTSVELSDTKRFPWFLRTIPSDVHLVKAIVALLQRLGWDHIQVIYDSDGYGKGGLSELKKRAGEVGICIVASYAFKDNRGDIITSLRLNSDVQPVVTFITDSRSLLELIKERSAQQEFVFIGTETWHSSGVKTHGLEREAFRSIIVEPQRLEFPLFNDYLSKLKMSTYKLNPWFGEWYSSLFNCSFTDVTTDTPKCVEQVITSSPEFETSTYTSYALATVYTLVTGLDETLKEICGRNYDGACPDFRNRPDTSEVLLKHLSGASFYHKPRGVSKRTDFEMINRESGVKFDVYIFNSAYRYQKLAEYVRQTDALVITDPQFMTSLMTVQSSCPTPCLACTYMFSNQPYMHIPGDIHFAAILDLHDASPKPFSCGKMREKNGFIKTEAIRFALDKINKGEAGDVKLNNVQLGALVMDGCTSALWSTTLLSRFVGSTGLNDPNLEGRMYAGWITDNSRSTVEAGKLLKKLDMALVSPGARSPMLDDKTRFGTFFRTAVSDGRIIDGMIKVATASGFQYVVVLNSPDPDNRDARDKFVEQAHINDICIAKSIEFDAHGDYEKIARDIRQSGTDVVVVFSEPLPHVAALLKTRALNGVKNLRFMSNYAWNMMLKGTGKWASVQHSLTFQVTQPKLTQFEDYLNNLTLSSGGTNPWFNKYYENIFNCSLVADNPRYMRPCSTNPPKQINFDSRDSSILTTFDAVYSYATAIHLTLMQLCGDQYNGTCGEFFTNNDTYRLIVEKLDQVSFEDSVHLNSPQFAFASRESGRHIQVLKIDGNEEKVIGDLDMMQPSDMTALARHYVGVQAMCVGACVQCDRISKTSDEFVYVPGHVIIAGLFDVHKPGTTPYNCGGINDKHGLELSEAFLFAVDYVNKKRGIFKNKLTGVDLGALLFDVCQQPSRSGNLVANIHSGNKPLFKDNNRVPTNRIDAYVGPFSTESSIRVADVLDVLGIPMISYGATSMELQDHFKYRYFMRSVPADDKQARAIISFLKFNEINYVQTIYSYDSVGEQGRKEFARLANLNGICVTAEHVVGKNNSDLSSQVRKAVADLVHNREAKTVILFVDDPLIVLHAAENDFDVAGKYLMIGTDKWGIDLDLSKSRLNKVLKNAVTFDIESADVPEFDAYLDNKTPENYKKNPWFNEYYQYIFNCSSTNALRMCKRTLFGISRSDNYIQDTYALYVINAVFSAALGIHKAIESQCPGFDHACDAFIMSGERRQLILSGIKSARFIDSTKQPFYYTSTGESDRGYHIYEVVKGNSQAYSYKNLGSYNDTDFLKIDHTYKLQWQSKCGDALVCKNCDFTGNQPSRFMLNASTEDLNIIGIFDVHALQDRFHCGEIDLHHGFQNMLAFHYAIDEINQNRDRAQRATLKLGGLALDTCSNPAGLGQDIYSLMSGEALCSDTSRGQLLPPATVVAYITMGSENSVVASSLLSPRKVTSFSPSATSVQLSDATIHSHFLRAVPPDNQQADVMVSLLRKFGFSYASAVYSSDSYGRDSHDQLLKSAYSNKKSVCIAKTIEMKLEANSNDATKIVKELQNILGSKVVIVFLTTNQMQLLLKAARDLNLVGRFIWLGSERWGNDPKVVRDLNEISTGAITLQIHSAHVDGFQKYMKSLSLGNHGPLPKDWFEEFYQSVYQCRIIDSLRSKNFPRVCDGSEKRGQEMIVQDRSVLHTIISVNMIAQGLQNIDQCRNSRIAGCLDVQSNKRDLIYQGIHDAQWKVLPADLKDESFDFSLNEKGYGNIRYNIYNYVRNGTAGTFAYKKIGYWQKGDLDVDTTAYRGLFSTGSRAVIPASNCPSGSRSQCEAPDGNSYVCVTSRFTGSSSGDGSSGGVAAGQSGDGSSDGFQVDLDARYVDAWGIIVVVLATMGAFMSLCLFVYLLVVYPIKTGTSVLGYLLILGVFTMFLMVYPFVLHVNNAVCGVRRFGLSLSYCICFAALFVKLLDSWRSRKKADLSDVKYAKLGQPLGLLFIAIVLIVIQILLNAEWLGFQSPTTEVKDYDGEVWRRCAPVEDAGFMLNYDKSLALSLVYIHVLIVLCFILGCCTWRSSKNHNETRWIFIAILFTIPCVVLWGVISCMSPVKYRDAAVAIGVLFNAFILFTFVPVRKLYLYHKFHSQLKMTEEVEKLSHDPKGAYSVSSSVYGHQYDNTPRYQDDGTSQSRRQMSFMGY